MTERARRIFRWVAWVAGLGLLVVVLGRLGWSEIVATLARTGWAVVWLAAIYGCAYSIMGLPWRLLMPPERRPDTGAAIASRIAASGVNAFLPLFALGEVARLLWLRREDWPEGVAAIVVDRLLFALASAMAVAAGAVALAFVPQSPGHWAAAAILLALGIVALVIMAAVIARRAPAHFLRRLVRNVRRALVRLRARHAGVPTLDGHGAAERIDAALRALLRGPKRRLAVGLGLHLVGRTLLIVETYVACNALGLRVELDMVVVLAAVPIVLSVIGAVVPGQVGVQESAQGTAAAMLGLGSGAGVLIVLLQRGRQLLFVPITVTLLALRPHRRCIPSLPDTHLAPRPSS